jgi:hypothetical protein
MHSFNVRLNYGPIVTIIYSRTTNPVGKPIEFLPGCLNKKQSLKRPVDSLVDPRRTSKRTIEPHFVQQIPRKSTTSSKHKQVRIKRVKHWVSHHGFVVVNHIVVHDQLNLLDMSDQPQEQQVKEESEAPIVQQDGSTNANEQSDIMIVDEAHPLPSNKLFEGFYIALSHGDIDMDTATAVALGELQRKITEHGGTFHREINERVR